MPELVFFVALLVVVGVLVTLATAVTWARGGRSQADLSTTSPAVGLGMSIGMLLGAVLGVIVWISTGQFVLWVVFLGAGMSAGLAIGSGMAQRRR
jgi:hypothetical protein